MANKKVGRRSIADLTGQETRVIKTMLTVPQIEYVDEVAAYYGYSRAFIMRRFVDIFMYLTNELDGEHIDHDVMMDNDLLMATLYQISAVNKRVNKIRRSSLILSPTRKNTAEYEAHKYKGEE